MKIHYHRLSTGSGFCRGQAFAYARSRLRDHLAKQCYGVLILSAALVGILPSALGETLSETAIQQIQAMQAEKDSFTPAQQKMDSQLIFALKASRNERIAGGAVPNLRIGAKADANSNIMVDITATVSSNLVTQIQSLGATIITSFPQFNYIRASIPLSQAENIAGLAPVRFVRPAVPFVTNNSDPEGVVTHRDDFARINFDVDGSGVRIGVISDSVDFLGQAQALGDLGPVTVLPGQSGVPATGEGSAMLEIVHAMTPGADLFFATGDGGPANFANNILLLRFTYGCDVIVDDLTYLNESPFQDAVIAQAVNSVTASGGLYFSSAGNSGNLDSGTSGTWEGDFTNAAPVAAPVDTKGGFIHGFGTNTYDLVTQPSSDGGPTTLFWSDPLGASTNDYDLYILDTNGQNIVSSSVTVQNGTQDPFEIVPAPNINERVVVVLATGTNRFLHVNNFRGQLLLGTAGNTLGHNAATNAFTVAAVDVRNNYPNPFTGGGRDPVEFFSSDGPRRMFYFPDGAPMTPGDFSATGGHVFQKPDVTAANGVTTSVPGFAPFYGTSAAAPHAAAIAGLIKSYNPFIGANQIRRAMTSTALDIMAVGPDRDSGVGIVMADLALAAAPVPPPLPRLVISTNYISGGNGNGVIDYNECNSLLLVLENIGRIDATGVHASLATTTPGVTIAQPNSSYPDISTNATSTNLLAFKISTAPTFVCGTPIFLVLTIKTDQLITFAALTLPTGQPGVPVRFDNNIPTPIPDNGITNSIINVTNVNFAITKLNVSLHITHPFDADLVLQLISPDGTTNTLSRNNGSSGQNYGLGCATEGQRTTFDDDALVPIAGGVPPFLGSFQPDQPLAVFNGKSGTNVNGPWRLQAADVAAFDVGTLDCWSLFFSPSVCTNGGGECPGSDLAIGIVAQPEPALVGDNLTYIISVTNFGPSSAKSVAVSQVLPSSVILVSATSSQGSAAQSGGVVTASLGPMASGGTAIITVVVLPTTVGLFSSSATVSSEQPDFDLSNNSATVFSHVNPPTADLAVGFVANPTSLLVGGNVTYALSVTNNGPSAASGVVVTNVFPGSVLLGDETLSQGNLVVSSNNVICYFGALARGATASATITATPTALGTFVSTATLNAAPNQPDPILNNNSATAVIAVGPAADLSVQLEAHPNPVVLSSNVTYITTVSNAGPSIATAVNLTQTLPLGVTVLSNILSQGTTSLNGTNLVCHLGSLLPHASATLTVVVTTTKLGFLSSTSAANATETDPNLANNSATVAVAVGLPFVTILPAGASLTSESFAPPDGSIEPGETVTVQFRLQNLGNVVNTNLVATLLPTGGVISPTGPQTYGILQPIGVPGGVSVSRPFNFTAGGSNGGAIVATLQLVDGGISLPPATFTFQLPTVTSFQNTNPITIPDPIFSTGSGPANPYPSTLKVSGVSGQIGKVTVTLSGLTHTYPHDISALLVGPTGAQSLLMSHIAGLSSAQNVNLVLDQTASDPLPPTGNLSSGSWRPAAYSPAPIFSNPAPAGPYVADLSVFGGVNPNGSWTLYVLDDSDGDIGSIANGWSLSLIGVSPVNQVADIGVSVSATPNPIFVGDRLTYRFVITNGGPGGATGVTFSNSLPAGVTLVSASASQGNLVTNGNLVVGNLASLAAGASATVSVVVIPSAPGQLADSASVSAFETDLHTANNTVSISLPVNTPTADVGLGMLANLPTVLVGSNISYTISVTNNGPNNALNVVVTDSLPPGTSYNSANVSQGSVAVGQGSVVASLGSLAPGSSATIVLNLTALSAGLLTNSVSASTTSTDSVQANNSASVVVTASNPSAIIVAAGATLTAESFLPADGSIEPGETVTLSLGLANTGVLDAANLTATLLALGGVTAPSGPANYGRLAAGGLAVTRPFSFTAGAPASGVIVATLQLQDGANNLGTVSFDFTLPSTNSYANANGIVIPDHGPGSPYPSIINISGVTGFVGKVTVTLHGLTHSFPNDVNVLLVSPSGANVLLMSHTGGAYGLTNVSLTFDDAAPVALVSGGPLSTGTYRPSEYGGGVSFPNPAAAPPYGIALSALNATDPNGFWLLYVLDDRPGDSGMIASGWTMNLTTLSPVAPLADLALGMSAEAPSVVLGSTVTFDIGVTNTGPSAAPAVVLTDILPGGFSVLSTNTSQGSVSLTGGSLTWNIGNLDVGSAASLKLVTLPSRIGAFVNVASVTGAVTDQDPGNNSSQVMGTVTASPHVTLSGSINSGLFQLSITAPPNSTYVIQASSDLGTWVPVSTNTAGSDGTIIYSDPASSTLQSRFYRAVQQAP